MWEDLIIAALTGSVDEETMLSHSEWKGSEVTPATRPISFARSFTKE
jgi:hypothetical protein